MKPDNSHRKIIIEKNKQFSRSALWRIQRDFFDREGIHAWTSQVPFYITSNPFIARSYARIVLAFIRDLTRQDPEAKNHPFYILEPGTGSGRFSYYFIKTLDELLQNANMADIRICHVMSDFTRSNLQYWEQQHALQPYLARGLIDFAIYDMEADRPIILSRSKIQLNQETLINPLIVFANYIFDTSLNDLFAVRDNKLYELTVTLETEESNVENNWPKEMEKVDIHYQAHEIHSDYYHHPHIDNVLTLYKNSLKESVVLFPTGAFHVLGFLKKLANDRLLLISTDKGHGALHTLDGIGRPAIYFHGNFFSAMVNFHAIGQYLKNAGGDFFLQTPRKGIKTSVFSSHFTLRDLPETWQTIQDWVEGFSPADYFTLHRRISDSFEECNLETLASHLELANWDPHIYLKLSRHILSLLPDADRDTQYFLAQNMQKLAANFYDMPQIECVLFEIALFFHQIKQYETAIEYYTMAKPFVGDRPSLDYNIGLCLHFLGNNKDALIHFKKALALQPTLQNAEDWVVFLEHDNASTASSEIPKPNDTLKLTED